MNDEISIRFTAAQLDVVANALGQRPYMESAPVIQEISRQVQAHQQHQGGQPLPNLPDTPAQALQ